MSLLTDLLRPFWLAGLHEVTGKQTAGIPVWLVSGEYQIRNALTADTVVLTVAAPKPLIAAFAADCSRMSSAAVETLDSIAPSRALPKSIGWLLIQSYYAAFFAAHGVLRVFGRSCSQLDRGHLNRVHEIADVFEQRGTCSLSRGQYGGIVDASANSITLTKRSGDDGGSHGAMWGMFVELLRDLTAALLEGGTAPGPAQQVAAKIIELERALTADGGSKGGSWLSQIRNRANYQMGYGAWFPYSERVKYYDQLFATTALWRTDPMKIQIWLQKGRELQRFLEASMLIVAICRVMCEDMALRCPRGKSFHRFGSLPLLARMTQP